MVICQPCHDKLTNFEKKIKIDLKNMSTNDRIKPLL